MTSKIRYLEAKVSAGNFILGLMVLLLAYEYFTSRYLSRFPDYRLSYVMGAVTVSYFLALRFINYNKRREMPGLLSAATSTLDLLAALGVVGIALEYGNYPVAFLLNVDPSLYSFAPPGSISVFVLTAAYVLFIIPGAVTHFFLPPIPQPKIAPQAPIKITAGDLDDLITALEQTTDNLRNEEGPTRSAIDPRNLRLLLRLDRVVDQLRSLWQGLELEGRTVMEFPEAGRFGATRRRRSSESYRLIVLVPETAAPPEKESLTEVLVANPWASVLARRTSEGTSTEE